MIYYNKDLDPKKIKDSIDPYDFYMREQANPQYYRGTSSWIVAGLCPFHDDSRSGSFKVNLETGAFKCWSCGASGGDIIAFIQKRYELGFVDALRQLAKEWEVV